MISCSEGSTVSISTEFLTEDGQVLLPKVGWPRVVLQDENRDTLFMAGAAPDPLAPGKWTANITIPTLGLKQKSELSVQWRFVDQEGSKYSYREKLVVSPVVERRETDIVIMFDEPDFSFVLPLKFNPISHPTHSGSLRIYKDNDAIGPELDLADPIVSMDTGLDRTAVYIPVPTGGLEPRLSSYMVRVRLKTGARSVTYPFKLWTLTPTMSKAMTFLEDFLNKARVENVIPQLEYTSGDLLGYLERGLYMFNRLIHTTGFTGTNMQGMLFDAWTVGSCYYALSSQLLAEGQLAFDFSGQGVSLNVDRTPQLDAALGRIESDIDNRIVPFKKEIVKQGVTGGDGSNGGTAMRNSRSFAKLALTNAPTTRINGLPLGAHGRVFRSW